MDATWREDGAFVGRLISGRKFDWEASFSRTGLTSATCSVACRFPSLIGSGEHVEKASTARKGASFKYWIEVMVTRAMVRFGESRATRPHAWIITPWCLAKQSGKTICRITSRM